MNIAFIPDVQAKDGICFKYLSRVGRYIAEKQPEVVVQIGDFVDMEALSSYDAGKMASEGRRIKKDLDAGKRAMDALMTPIAKARGYKPRLELTMGNHEDRINRTIQQDAKWEGMLTLDSLRYQDYGWRVHPFQKPVKIGGVMFAHYFITGQMGKPYSTARAMLKGTHMSCMAGHKQGKDVYTERRGDGLPITCYISGSCYEHYEKYLGPQGNNHWRGLHFLHDVKDGTFDPMDISLPYLKRRYS